MNKRKKKLVLREDWEHPKFGNGTIPHGGEGGSVICKREFNVKREWGVAFEIQSGHKRWGLSWASVEKRSTGQSLECLKPEKGVFANRGSMR